MTDDPDIRMATSVMDYIFRRLALDHLPYDERAALGIFSAAERAAQQRGEDPARRWQEAVDREALAQSAPIEAAADSRSRSRAGRAASTAAESHQAQHRRRAALHDLRHQDAPGGQLLRLRGLRLHQRLQLEMARVAIKCNTRLERLSLVAERGSDIRSGPPSTSLGTPGPGRIMSVGLGGGWYSRSARSA